MPEVFELSLDTPLGPITLAERRVWRAMCEIAAGQTRSYGALARNVGSGPRAVAGACACNPIGIIIPCHRVVAADGLGGFSAPGGVDTKRALLRLEGVAV